MIQPNNFQQALEEMLVSASFSTKNLTVEETHLLNSLCSLLQQVLTHSPVEAKGIYIGFLGPLGVGKTTLAAALTAKLGAQFIVKEPYLHNPFWKESQTNPQVMLRSQLYFLLSNIKSDQQAIAQRGIAISDTSTLTDIVMWAQWYYEIGHLTEKEYEIYSQFVELLKSIIPRPSLLITLIPDNVSDLYAGIRQRHAVEESRVGELVFSEADLSAQIERVSKSAQIIKTLWDTNVLIIRVNPRTIYIDQDAQEIFVKQVMEALDSVSSP